MQRLCPYFIYYVREVDFDYVLRILVSELLENKESPLAEIVSEHHEHNDEPISHGQFRLILEHMRIALKCSLKFPTESKASELANLWLECTSTTGRSRVLTAMAFPLL